MTELTLLDAGQLREGFRGRRFTALDVTRACLQRIRDVDGGVNAFLRLNSRAEDEAAEADERLATGDDGPLLGVPVALKDNLNTEGLETTCASEILSGYLPLRDATAVARIRKAGAIIVGKTNMDEFAMGSSNENSAMGPTRNPWDHNRVPGGSSGGSAAAVAARMVPLALGSDTGGSIRQPAAFCGTVGLKPTYGRVSRSGLVAFGSSLDQIGPLARTVADAATVLQVIAGVDPDDATSSARPTGGYVASCSRGVTGLRVGMPREYFEGGLDGEIEAVTRRAATELERAGARIEEVSLPHTRYAVPTYYVVATAEASSNLARYDGIRFGRRKGGGGLQEMYRTTRGAGFGDEVKRRIMLGTFALSAGYYDQFYGKAQRVRALLRRDFLDVFQAGIDLLLTPTTPTTAFRLSEKMSDPLEMYLSDVYTTTANLAGLPALVVPVGRSRQGLPVAVQLIGPDFREDLLFGAGATLERASILPPPPMPPSGGGNGT